MTNGSQKKTRSQLVAGLDPVPKLSTRIWETASRGEVILRVVICLLAALFLVVATQAWAPPFTYRVGDTPSRNITARTDFTQPNERKVKQEREKAKQQARLVWENDPKPLIELRGQLVTEVGKLLETETLDAETEAAWQRFLPRAAPDPSLPDEERQRREQIWRSQFEQFRHALDKRRLAFSEAVDSAFVEIEQNGLREELEPPDGYAGNQSEIIVYPVNDWDGQKPIAKKEVQTAYVEEKLLDSLKARLAPLEQEIKQQARSEARQTYVHNAEPLVSQREALMKKIDAISKAAAFDEKMAALWQEFLVKETADAPPSDVDQSQAFELFRKALSENDLATQLETTLAEILKPYEQRGLLVSLAAGENVLEGNQEEIYVLTGDDENPKQTVLVKSVRWADIKEELQKTLNKQIPSLEVAGRLFTWLENQLPSAASLKYQPIAEEDARLIQPALAELTHQWLKDHLPDTLEFNKERSDEVGDGAAAAVQPEAHATLFLAGDTLADADRPINEDALERLRYEYQELMKARTASEMISRAAATFGMYLALYTLCGIFMYYRFLEVLTNIHRFAGLLLLSVATVTFCYIADTWDAAMIPLLLFAMTVAIAYSQVLALLVSAAVGLVIVLSLGQGLASFVILMSATATTVLLLRRIRNRVRLVYVGFCAGAVALLTTIGVSIVDSQPLGIELLKDAGLYCLWGIAAGFAMTGLLPFIENIFGVLTDLSLLELGDVAHPLLQELVRRAPGTYNHSINVASMAEAAAESIGAAGLLARVGAYFHDIGKMLKPQYFVENQIAGDNQHEALVPAMSTLIIIAHVKDGAELAREHHLPRPIIDFIQQHHGTTLVEYFYQRASENSQQDPDSGRVDENTFRYPGPKPQSKEAGILMLADAVESASRVLVEPTPSRIESLVEELAMKRLLDGQLDESGLTLQEVRSVQDSLVKSLTAVYHGRVKYPDQRTA